MSRYSYSLSIENVRTFERARLELEGMRVLIGDNGTGKSTILEVLEVLRRTATTQNVCALLDQVHRGFVALARNPAHPISLRLRMSDLETQQWAEYCVSFRQALRGLGTELVGETATLSPRPGHQQPLRVLERDDRGARLYLRGAWVEVTLGWGNALLGYVFNGQVDGVHPELVALAKRVGAIQVHVGWEVLPQWMAAAHQRRSSMRAAQVLVSETALAPLGDNIVSVLHYLKNDSRENWERFLSLVRMGLELPVEDVNIKIGAEGGTGAVALKLTFRDAELPAITLSDGQLAWIGWSALLCNRDRPSIVALDEPDLHLHPALACRLVQELEVFAQDTPVLVATHSDSLLDALESPAQSVVPLVSAGVGSTVIGRLEPQALGRWREEYAGLGELRRQGMLSLLVQESESGDSVPGER